MELTLQAELRSGTGKGVARKLRAQGKIPAVLYGLDSEPIAIAVDRRELAHALHTEAGRNVLIDLQVNGQTHLTLAREIQRDVLRNEITHADFVRISRTQTIETDVPIHIEGESPGVKMGGILEHHLWQITVKCRPGSVPESLVADVSSLELNQSFYVRDLTAPDDVEIVSNADDVIVSCVTPQAMQVEAQLEAPAVEETGEGSPSEE